MQPYGAGCAVIHEANVKLTTNMDIQNKQCFIMLAVKFESEEVRSRERKKRDESKEREKKIGGEHKMLYYVTSDEDKCD